MKFTITTTLDVPIGNLLKRRLLNLDSVERGLADEVKGGLNRQYFSLNHSISGRIKIGRVTVRKKV